jgi:TetR/AcrR family transcriptional regulator
LNGAACVPAADSLNRKMAKSRTRTDFVREWELSAIGRRLLREWRQFATVRRIVVAARNVFAQRGLSGARMDQIARAAGVNKALPYYYFRNKEEIHRFVLETTIAQVCAAMKSPEVLAMPPTERVCALVNTTFDYVMRNPAYPRLVQRGMMSDRRRLHWMVVSYHRPLHVRVAETIREGIALGQFQPVDPDQTVFTIFGMIQHYFATGPLASQI